MSSIDSGPPKRLGGGECKVCFAPLGPWAGGRPRIYCRRCAGIQRVRSKGFSDVRRGIPTDVLLARKGLIPWSVVRPGLRAVRYDEPLAPWPAEATMAQLEPDDPVAEYLGSVVAEGDRMAEFFVPNPGPIPDDPELLAGRT